jgi:hypothetical protein
MCRRSREAASEQAGWTRLTGGWVTTAAPANICWRRRSVDHLSWSGLTKRRFVVANDGGLAITSRSTWHATTSEHTIEFRHRASGEMKCRGLLCASLILKPR